MTSSNPGSVPVAPDSVRVWRGFRLGSLTPEVFRQKLGSIFIPGTVQIQAPVGLTAYLPSVLPDQKSPVAPDEIAIVFYEYQNAYHEAKETVGGRAYSDLHGLVFDLSRSTSGFPIKFEGEIELEMRYHLFDAHIDWQRGAVNAFVGVRREGDTGFVGSVTDWLKEVQAQGDDGPDGAITVVASDYVTYWENWQDGNAGGSLIPRLAAMTEPAYQQAMPKQPLGEGLWEPYGGVTVNGGESFNCQFPRRKNA